MRYDTILNIVKAIKKSRYKDISVGTLMNMADISRPTATKFLYMMIGSNNANIIFRLGKREKIYEITKRSEDSIVNSIVDNYRNIIQCYPKSRQSRTS